MWTCPTFIRIHSNLSKSNQNTLITFCVEGFLIRLLHYKNMQNTVVFNIHPITWRAAGYIQIELRDRFIKSVTRSAREYEKQPEEYQKLECGSKDD